MAGPRHGHGGDASREFAGLQFGPGAARSHISAPVRAIGPARAPTSTATNGTSVGPVPVRTPVWGGGSGIAPAWGSRQGPFDLVGGKFALWFHGAKSRQTRKR